MPAVLPGDGHKNGNSYIDVEAADGAAISIETFKVSRDPQFA